MATLASDVRVEGEGPEPAAIMLIGEAPGEVEVKQRRPFVGAAGKVLDGLLREVGIQREECYVDNICQFRPKDNKFKNLYDTRTEGGKKVTVPSELLQTERARLLETIHRIGPNIVIALGGEPLGFLCPQTSSGGITSWRGSIIQAAGGQKVMGTFHPSYLLRQWSDRLVAAFDLRKAKVQSTTPEVKRIARDTYVLSESCFEASRAYLKEMLECKRSDRVAFDIEVEGKQRVICIGLSDDIHRAIVMPIVFRGKELWNDLEKYQILKSIVIEILESPKIKKIAQNAQYDMIWLKREWDIDVKPLYMDTMVAHSLLVPGLNPDLKPKSLAFQCSMYTDIPYYKFMGKTDDAGTMFRYNGMDAMATFECAEKIEQYLHKENMWDFYNELPHQLLEPLREMSMRGIRIDHELRKEMTDENEKEQELLTEAIKQEPSIQEFERDHLQRIAKKKLAERYAASKASKRGMLSKRFNDAGAYVASRAKTLPSFNPNASPQLVSYLYGYRKWKPILAARANRARTPTANRDALEKLLARHKEPILQSFIDLHDLAKEHEFLTAKLERDGRLHCTYDITGTETGRLSSRKYVTDTGANLQNQPAGKRKDSNLRRMFIPDPEKVFLQRDLKQAEAWVVAFLSRDLFFIEAIRSSDVHRYVGSLIFRKPEADISLRERDMAKRCVHALNYGMGFMKFSEVAKITPVEARVLRNRYFATFPRLSMWHAEVKQHLLTNRVVVTPFGRKREFTAPWGEVLWKEAWAYVPQSTVGDLLNVGFLAFWRWLKQPHPSGVPNEIRHDCQIMLQIHDSLVVQCPKAAVGFIAAVMKQHLERPIVVGKETITIPSDCSVGDNWKDLKEIDA